MPGSKAAGAAFEEYVAPARRRPAFWRLLAGVVIILACWLIGALIVLIGLAVWLIARERLPVAEVMARLEGAMSLTSSEGVVIALLTFWGIWAGVAIAVWTLHRRGPRTVLAAPGRPLLAGFWLGALIAAVLVFAPLLITLPFSEPPLRSDVGIGDWAVWLAILVPLIFLQAGGEELIFRGYLQQQLAARFASPWVWALIPSLLFGMMHFVNPALGLTDRLLYVAVTALFGLAAAAMVVQTGGLGAALGFHVTVNLAGLSLFGMEGVHDGVSLYIVPEGDFRSGLIADCILMAAFVAFVVSPLSPFRRRGKPPRGGGD